MLLQLFLSLTCCASGLAQQVISPQQQFDKIFNTPVLQQEGVNYNVIDVLQPLFEADASLKKICNSDLEYLKLFVNSQKFYNHIRWYSNSLILDTNQIPVANEQQIIEEAVAWSAERGFQTANPKACVSQGGIEVATRARLLALREVPHSVQDLRTHFNRSIPEFAGTIKLSWIRLPLFNSENGAALGEGERIAMYDLLDKLATQLNENKLSWEDAVKSYCKDPVTSTRAGKVGYVKRDSVQLEESFRRQLFSALGFKRIDDTILRGPIIGNDWIYLARLESVIVRGVIELQLFKNQVQRSLAIHEMYNKLNEFSTDVNRAILLPLAN